MADILVLVAGVFLAALLAATAYVTSEYRKQLLKAQKEYEKAKDTVEDVVLSFNRELRREAERIEAVSFKIDGTTSKADACLKKAENIEKRVAPLESKLNQISSEVNAMTEVVSAISETNAKTIEKLASVDVGVIDTKLQDIEVSQEKLLGVDTKVCDIEATQEALKGKIRGLEEQLQKLTFMPESRSEVAMSAMPVMPIKRDKAMAALTNTEVAVLEFLAAEGPKTAPEIKEKVQLSREHTARLMKKLYETGYLERETGKLPFKYSVKKEMEKILRKPESTAS